MDTKQHQMIVGCFIKNKLEEYEYFLRKIILICKVTDKNFKAGINPVNTSGEDINFVFSAFVNTFQTLKDSLQTATDKKIDWARFSNVKHADFMKESRNAITHDGFQIIDTYIDGCYYISKNIERMTYGKPVSITSPTEDILTICLEFTTDFINELETILNDFGDQIPNQTTEQRAKLIEEQFLNMPKIHQFAKDLFIEKREEIMTAIHSFNHDSNKDIRKQFEVIRSVVTEARNPQ